MRIFKTDQSYHGQRIIKQNTKSLVAEIFVIKLNIRTYKYDCYTQKSIYRQTSTNSKKKQYDSKSNVNIYPNIETYIDIFVTCNIKKLKLDIGAHVQI